MSVEQTLRQWLATGETDRVIETLQNIAERYGDKYFQNDVTHQAGRFNSLKRDRQNGTISDEFYNLQLNNIRVALQDIISKVPTNATLEGQTNAPVSTSPTLDQPATASNGDPIAPRTSPHIPWIVGLGLLVVATLLAAIIPCPSESLSLSSRILLALGAAGVATILPGLLNIDLQGVKAGSAIGVFVLIYLVNPAKAIENTNACNNEPFEFTINLQPDRNEKIASQYPKLESATLQIWIANDWKDAKIDANNLARYYSLPGDYKDQKAAVQLLGKYWNVKADSVQLSGKSQTLTIAPDGSLGKIEGKVKMIDGAILPNAEVEIEGVLDTTDIRGSFSILIPLDKQKNRYIYTVQKKGYETKTEPFDFDGEAIEIRMKKQ